MHSEHPPFSEQSAHFQGFAETHTWVQAFGAGRSYFGAASVVKIHVVTGTLATAS